MKTLLRVSELEKLENPLDRVIVGVVQRAIMDALDGDSRAKEWVFDVGIDWLATVMRGANEHAFS